MNAENPVQIDLFCDEFRAPPQMCPLPCNQAVTLAPEVID